VIPQVVSIPIGLVEPHPKLMLRFRYDVGALAELIRSSVDESTPNGQLNPGRVVSKREGKGYWVYIGVRRYFALKQLHEKDGDERFGTYNAYVDSNTMSELLMFMRAKMENEEEKGERRGLSLLEEVLGLSRIRESISPETRKELSVSLARRLEIAETTSGERLRRLYDVEQATRFRFGVAHLQGLGKITDDEEFYLTAACVAEYRLEGGDIDSAIRGMRSAYSFRWFEKMFPSFRAAQGGVAAVEQQAAASTQASEQEPRESDSDQKEPASAPMLEVHERGVIVVECRECGCENLVRIRGDVEVTQLAVEPGGEGYRATPDTVSMFACKCSACDEEFYVLVKQLGGREYALETSSARAFREPRATVQAVDLRFDQKEGVWQKVVGGEVVGVVEPGRAGTKKTVGRK
jgi:hypothetical protein